MFKAVFKQILAIGLLCTISQLYFGLQIVMAQAPNVEDKSLLWKISGNGLAKESYLFGTIHQICDNRYLWTAPMERAFDESEKICMEMDLDDPKIQMEMVMGLISTDGKSLKSYFTDAQYAAIEAYLKSNLAGNPIVTMMDKMQPVGLYTILMQSLVKCTVGQNTSYEMNLMQKATSTKKEILGLESPKDQIQALLSMPVDSVLKQINAIVSGDGKNTDLKMYEDMVSKYELQDIVGLKTLMDEQAQAQMSLEVMLDDRNEKWIAPMQDMMQRNSIFFAVGAGHLAGPKGVIALLRKLGYNVEPVYN